MAPSCHCEERKRRSNPETALQPGLLRFARNDGVGAERREPWRPEGFRSMSTTRFAIAAAAFVVWCAPAWASDAPPGASSCSGCHAPSAAVGTPVPPLNGRAAADIVAQLEAFRSGKT